MFLLLFVKMGEITAYPCRQERSGREGKTTHRVENWCNNVLESRGGKIDCTRGRVALEENSLPILREKVEVWSTDAGDRVHVGWVDQNSVCYSFLNSIESKVHKLSEDGEVWGKQGMDSHAEKWNKRTMKIWLLGLINIHLEWNWSACLGFSSCVRKQEKKREVESICLVLNLSRINREVVKCKVVIVRLWEISYLITLIFSWDR